MTGLTNVITSVVGVDIFAKAPCIAQDLQSPLTLYALQVCGPAAFMVWLLLVFGVAQIIRRNFFSLDGLLNTLGEVLVEFYVSVTLAVFTPFKCYACRIATDSALTATQRHSSDDDSARTGSQAAADAAEANKS